jgi:ketosteroid isomerase-like protein
MSQQNVDAFRAVIGAINERGADADLELLDREIEFREDPEFPGAQVYRGRDEVVRNFREFTASFDYFRFEIEDLRDAGEDKVVAVLHEQARGKASGLKVDRRSGWVTTFRDGKVLSFEIYLDPANAVEAAAVRE